MCGSTWSSRRPSPNQVWGRVRLLTLFFAPRTTPGARRWLGHMRDTEALTSPISPHATPFLRSANVIFHNGVEDFRTEATALEQLVARINAAGYRSTLAGGRDGRLLSPDGGRQRRAQPVAL